MKRLALLTLFATAVSALHAQEFDGSWRGEIAVGGGRLPVVFNIAGAAATLDSPDQLSYGIPIDSVLYGRGSVTLSSERLDMTFTGAKLNDRTVAGLFTQRGFRVPMTLVRCEPLMSHRPQEPMPPYPYAVEEVEFATVDGDAMHGTLTIPRGECRAAAVLVTGSGTQNRDEEIFGHKPFKLLADRLARRGIATLRYDDREYATGVYAGATTLDYASDAMQALALLRGRSELSAAEIGIIGHSEGGTIAFICAAAGEGAPDFVVSLAGMTVKGADCILAQNLSELDRMTAAGGMSRETADAIYGFTAAVFSEIDGMTAERIRSEAEAVAARCMALQPDPVSLAAAEREVAGTLASMNEWLAAFISLDPAEYISKTSCRVLALNGDRDVQVAADANLGRLRTFANLDGRLDERTLAGLNHMFQHCTSGAVAEYAVIGETMSEEVPQIVADWILGGE